MPQPALEPAHEEHGKVQQPVGDATRIHHQPHQDEERQGNQCIVVDPGKQTLGKHSDQHRLLDQEECKRRQAQ